MGGVAQAGQSLTEDKIHVCNQRIEPPVAQEPSTEPQGKKGNVISRCIFMPHMELCK